MVHFIGAGPGDPDLITVKGKRLIEEADVIIYAGSLVNPQVLAGARPDAAIYNSAGMTLPEVIAVMKEADSQGKTVARVHTGDPSVYGAHREQMVRLDELGIPYDVVPGVSSFLAAAASMKKEYTLPGISQCYPGIQLSALSGAGEPLLYLLEGTMFQSPVYIDFFGIPIFLWIIQERSFRSFWQSGLPPGVKSCLTGLCRIW